MFVLVFLKVDLKAPPAARRLIWLLVQALVWLLLINVGVYFNSKIMLQLTLVNLHDYLIQYKYKCFQVIFHRFEFGPSRFHVYDICKWVCLKLQ